MSGARRPRRAPGVAAAIAIAGCVGPRGTAPLPPAGANNDDGAGQLAQASVQIQLDDGADFDAAQASMRNAAASHYRRPARPGAWTPGSGVDPALGGSVYGLDTSVGGAVYGFLGSVNGTFGVIGVALPPHADAGDGAVQGALTWRGDRGVAWPAGCAGARVAKAGGAVAGAVVYLASAPLRRERFDDDRLSITRGAIAADGCALWPPAQAIGPMPALVDVENGGPTPLALAAGRAGAVTLEPGGRWTLPVGDGAPMRIDAGERAPAWVLGQTHDYATVTDALGRFALEGVPAGTYELVVWYPPLVRSLDAGKPVWTAPTVVRRSVTVGRSGAVRLTLALDPSP